MLTIYLDVVQNLPSCKDSYWSELSEVTKKQLSRRNNYTTWYVLLTS